MGANVIDMKDVFLFLVDADNILIMVMLYVLLMLILLYSKSWIKGRAYSSHKNKEAGDVNANINKTRSKRLNNIERAICIYANIGIIFFASIIFMVIINYFM